MREPVTRAQRDRAASPSMVPHRDQRGALQIDGQYLEQHVHHRLVGLVEDGVVDVARFEKEIAGAVDDGLVGQHVGHGARGHLADAGAFVIVLAHMSAGRERQFGDAQLVLSVDLLEEALERCFEPDLRHQALGIDLHRAHAHLRARRAGLREQRHEWNGRDRLKNVAPDRFIVRHDRSPITGLSRSPRRWSCIRCGELPANQCKDWTTCAAARVLRSIMHDYGQYCPVARAAEILADRWTLLIIRELLADVHHFNELELGLPRMSRTLLAERLRRLQRTGVLERRGAARGQRTEYRLTRAGRELQPIIDQFGGWGARWAFGDPRRNELDPIVLLWWMRRRVAIDAIGKRRLVIQFDFSGGPRQSYWLLIEPADVSVCLKHPGFDIDVIVSADIVAFYRLWLGRVSFAEAVRRQQVRLSGTTSDVRAFPHWFALSPMAERVRAALTDRRRETDNRKPPQAVRANAS